MNIPEGVDPDSVDEKTLFATGFETALLGIGQQFNRNVAVYDYEACVEILTKEGLTLEEAEEHMSFNVTGAWVGECTPVFLRKKES